jgi:hypothetical protein
MTLVSLTSFHDQMHHYLGTLNPYLGTLNRFEQSSFRHSIQAADKIIAQHSDEPIPLAEAIWVKKTVAKCFSHSPEVRRAIHSILFDPIVNMESKYDSELGPAGPPSKIPKIELREIVVPMDIDETVDQFRSFSLSPDSCEYANEDLL